MMARDQKPLDTIVALSTAPGKAAVAVIRISGPSARQALMTLGVRRVRPRQAELRTIRDSRGLIVDRGLVLWFPGPTSYTGEDCAEVHLHGGRFVTGSVLTTLVAGGVRLAEPGEFTRRAFQNGKMDLSEAEAVADLIEAESAAQARQAIQQLQGALGDRYRRWREQLIDVLARLEVLVDFPEDDTGHALQGVKQALTELEGDLAAAVADGLRGQRIRDGYRVAIIGPPNAGKSSLFNAMISREAAIVSDMPGTTRDIIECVMDLEGYRVLIADTAGLHAADNPVEREGIRRALAWAQTAARRIWVLDGSGETVDSFGGAPRWRAGDLVVLNKSDLRESGVMRRVISSAAQSGVTVLRLSVTRDGSAAVLDWLKADVVAEMAGEDFPSVTRLRHQAALMEALESLQRAAARLGDPELGAEDVRLAARALASVTGDIATEDILGKVFATFCIGK